MPQKTRAQARTPATDAVTALQRADPPGTPGREVRSYSESERTAACMLAIVSGVAQAATKLDIPARTIYGWLDGHGGAAALRVAASDVLLMSQFGVALEVCEELRDRLKDMTVDQLIESIRVLGATGARSPAERAQSEPKTAPILIQLNNGRGGYDTLTVPAEAD